MAGIALCSVLSPLTGFAVEVSLARISGAAAPVDAYRATSTVLNVGNQLFFGAVTIQVLVPLLCQSKARGLERVGKHTTLLFGGLLFLVTLPLLYLMLAEPERLLLVLIPKAGEQTLACGEIQLRAFACALLPMLGAGVFGAFLQSRQIFWIAAIAQGFNNLAIATLMLFSRRADYSLAAGNLLGYTAMLALELVYFLKLDCSGPSSWRDSWRLTIHAVRLAIPALLALVPPIVIGAVILRTLSAGPSGTLAECGFAGKPGALVSLLPGVLFTIMLPELALRKVTHPDAFFPMVQRVLRFALVITIPLTSVLVVMRHPLIGALFGGHALGLASLDRISTYFAILAIGGPATAVNAAMGQVCAALSDTRAGLWAICVSLAVTLAIVPQAGKHFGPGGVMFALSATAWIICAWYATYSSVIHKVRGWLSLSLYGFKSTIVALAAAGLVAIAQSCLQNRFGASELSDLATLAIGGVLAILTVYVVGLSLGLLEIEEIAALLRWPVARGT
ncbi:MAG: lipid II flippase MurJ [Candidatus Binataceae bacterium]|jgi:peptidoglycan biosynthesis protein MviN/MurJ (putative lipid II flippase)